MRTRRLTRPALAALATATLAVAGCAESGDSAGPAPSAGTPSSSASASAADPAATKALGDAAAALGNDSFKVTMTSGPGLKLEGLMDAPGGKGTATLTASTTNTNITVKTLLVEQDLYLQVPGITKEGSWTHVDVARLPEGANVGLRPGQVDPAGTANLLSATTDVQQVDARSYRGTLDLTKVAGVAGVDANTVSTVGDAARSVPFTAGMDEQGRLSAMTVQIPAVNGQQAAPLEILYTDYGVAVTAERPAAGEVIEAPDSLYTSLGG